jgi:hypothetical protein
MSFLDNLKYRFATFSVAEKLILLNVVCFVLPMILNVVFFLFNIPSSAYMNWLQLSPNLGTFITRGLIFILSYALFPVFKGTYPPMIGASAGVMAVFIFICTYTPDQEIRFFFVNLKLKYLGLAFFFIDVIQIPYGNAGGHLAHIGGALLGFVYARQLARGSDIGAGFESVWKAVFKRKQLKTVYRAPQKKSSSPKKTNDSDHQNAIDDILDKISKSGYDSLTKEEKDFLFRSGKE